MDGSDFCIKAGHFYPFYQVVNYYKHMFMPTSLF